MRVFAAALATVLAAGSVLGLEAVVTDHEGRPINGARVCYLIGGSDGLCGETDEQGHFVLPDSRVKNYRVTAKGFLTVERSTDDPVDTIVLEPTSSIRIDYAVDGAVTAPARAEVYLISPDGERVGPFPGSLKGVRVSNLQPGSYGVIVRAKGFVQQRSVSLELGIGQAERIEVRLVAVPPHGESDGAQDETRDER